MSGESHIEARIQASIMPLGIVMAVLLSDAYDSVSAEFYFVGFMTRAQRVVTEVAAGWVASEELEGFGFAPHPGTGDEGFYGKATPEEASRALENVRTRLAECDVFKKVLGGARGSRSLAGEWRRSE